MAYGQNSENRVEFLDTDTFEVFVFNYFSKKIYPQQSSEQVTISCGTRVSKIPKYLDT